MEVHHKMCIIIFVCKDMQCNVNILLLIELPYSGKILAIWQVVWSSPNLIPPPFNSLLAAALLAMTLCK